MTTTNDRTTLEQKYAITEHVAFWKLRCKKCAATYQLNNADKGISPGNMLALLNHAASHDAGDIDE